MRRRFAFEFWGVQAAVEWEDPEFDQAARDLLLPIWTDQPDLRPEAVFEIVTGADGEAFVNGPDKDSFPYLKANVYETLERRLHLFLASQTRQVVFVHAGVVIWKDRAIILPGRSYAGKSTLVKALVKAGAGFYSDEYAIIDPQGMVHPFPRPISLRQSDGNLRLSAQEMGWTGVAGPVRAGAIVVCHYERGAVWKPEPLSAGSTVLQLLSNTVSAMAAPALTLACLSPLVEGVTCLTGVRGEAGPAAALMLQS